MQGFNILLEPPTAWLPGFDCSHSRRCLWCHQMCCSALLKIHAWSIFDKTIFNINHININGVTRSGINLWSILTIEKDVYGGWKTEFYSCSILFKENQRGRGIEMRQKSLGSIRWVIDLRRPSNIDDTAQLNATCAVRQTIKRWNLKATCYLFKRLAYQDASASMLLWMWNGIPNF